MEKNADVFLGYKEFRTEHYNKWEKSQSTRYFEYRKKWTGELLEMVMADLPAKEEQMVNIANATEEVVDHDEEPVIDER